MATGLDHGPELVKFARARIEQELGGPLAQPPQGEWTVEKHATFVTLRWRDGDLQGCIGTLEADRPIVADVAGNAVAAATRDPRGEHLVLSAIKDLCVELSILSPLERVASFDHIRHGIDGVVLIYRGRRGTFLPVMWETFRDKAVFFAQLERKAGLPPNYDPQHLEVWRYTAIKFEDPAK
ncbi:MAG TPA: AmmeMemoRadiSam system protein A [Kofleriaceae bacterium]|nr:AmmeMemoRadiSam system protein A [Kofleriaceae bacterium]